MDLKRLQFLVRVIDTGSITRAAAALHIAQPALSQHIRALEHSVGMQLLIRSKDGVTPTAAGLVAYRNAKMVARQMDRLQTEMRTLAALPAGRVTVGIAPHSHARRIIQPLLQQTARDFPEILLHISENFEGVLVDDLRLGRMDMALLYEISPRPGFRSEPVSNETLHIVGRPDLMGNAPPGTSSGIPMLLPSAAHALRQLVDATYGNMHARPHLVAEIGSFETLAAALGDGLGATVLPYSVAKDLAARFHLVVRPFGTQPTKITLSLATAAETPLSAAADAIYRLVTALIGSGADTASSPGQSPHPGPSPVS